MTGKRPVLWGILILACVLSSCMTRPAPYRIDSSRIKEYPFDPLGLFVSFLEVPEDPAVGLLAGDLTSSGITVLFVSGQDEQELFELIRELSYNVAYLTDSMWVASSYTIVEASDEGALLQTGEQTLYVGIESQGRGEIKLVTTFDRGLLDPLSLLSKESEEPHEIFSSGLLPLSYERKRLEATDLELGVYRFAVP